MTEQEKEMVKQSIQDHAAPMAQRILQSLDAKLSPKHPPKGAICEVWHDTDRHGTKLIGVPLGDGTFSRSVNGEFADRVSHYRRIVTAKEALEELERRRTMCPDVEGPSYEDGWTDAVTLIQHLIDNAERG